MESLKDYFKHIAREYPKTYLDKYPETIIRLGDLMQGTLLEIVAGTGNDLLWLFQNGMPPEKMVSLENDMEAYRRQSYTLHDALGAWAFTHMPIGIQDPIFNGEGIFNFIYANNTLHCLDHKEGIQKALSRTFTFLKSKGIFFGRTLSNKINKKRLESIAVPESEKQEFALKTARAVQENKLVGILPEELEDMAIGAGFSHTYTESKKHPWKPTEDYYFRFEKNEELI